MLHPNVINGGPVVPMVPGGRSRGTDCGSEWEVVNPTNTPFMRGGFVSRTQTCHDGDPTCDADRTADGACHFRVAVCLNQMDPALPTCTPGATSLVHTRPKRDPLVLANYDALLTALVALGGTRTGHNLNDVTFDPALAGSQCTEFTTLTVTKGTKQRFHLRSTKASGTDVDRVLLICS